MIKVLHLPTMFQRSWSGEEPHSSDEGALHFKGRPSVVKQKVVDLQALLNAGGRDGECFVQYGFASDVDSPDLYPRLSKAAIGAVQGTIPEMVVLAIDIDHEAHTVPPEGWHQTVLGSLDDDWRESLSWYRTPNGLRLLFTPQTPVPLRFAQSYLVQAHDALAAQGLPTDKGTRDWTRLFKLPRADRQDLQRDVDLSRPPLAWHPTHLEESDDILLGLAIERDMTHLYSPEVKLKVTRTQLKPLLQADEKLAEAIHSNALTPPKGERHATFLQAAIKICRAYETNDPLEPFKLLRDAAERSGKPLQELSSICHWAAAHYAGTAEVEAEERNCLTEEAAHHMRCRPEDVRQRLIVDISPEFFVWDEDTSRYSRPYRNQRQMLAALDRHCPALGGYQKNAEQALRSLSTAASRIVYTYLDEKAGYYEDTGSIFVRVCQQDEALVPRRSPEVEGWLKALFDGPYYDRVLDWLAAAPRLDQPVCALYIHAEPGVGKSLLALSLARLWSRESGYCNYTELTDNFNESLVESPLIWADEKAETSNASAFNSKSDSSVFRRMIGNSSFKVNAKFKTPATVEGYPRILITANNPDALGIREDLDASDIEAIKLRIGYVRANKEAEGWLAKRAKELGLDSARQLVDGWKTDGVFAQHILWLQATRRIKHGQRFLVEGWDSPLTEALPTSVGSTGGIVDAIIEAMTTPRFSHEQFLSVRWFNNCVYVSNPLLAAEWQDILPGEKLPHNTGRLKALKSLSGGNSKTLDLNIPGKARSQKYYWEIPVNLIAQVADQRKIGDPKKLVDMASRLTEDGDSTADDRHEVVLDLGRNNTRR